MTTTDATLASTGAESAIDDGERHRRAYLVTASRGLGRRRLLAAVRIAFGLAWATDAALKWLPSFANSTLLDTLKGARAGQPHAVKGWIDVWIGAVGTDPHLVAHVLAVGESVIALCLIVGAFTNLTCVLGSLLSLGIWTTAEGLGGPYMNGTTDVGASIIYVLVFVALAPADAGGYWGADVWLRPRLGRTSWLCSRAAPRVAASRAAAGDLLRKKCSDPVVRGTSTGGRQTEPDRRGRRVHPGTASATKTRR